jgi:serine/threonine-protein kinase RsbW
LDNPEIQEVAERCGASQDQVGDIALAVTEAAANAARHAYLTGSIGVFDLQTDLEGGEFVIRVPDCGTFRSPQAAPERLGVGLIIMQKLADACVIEACAPGTLVTPRFQVSA